MGWIKVYPFSSWGAAGVRRLRHIRRREGITRTVTLVRFTWSGVVVGMTADSAYLTFMCSISNTWHDFRRCSDQTFVPLFVRKCVDLVICATHLYAPVRCIFFWLQINLISVIFGENNCCISACFLCHFTSCCRFSFLM